MFEDAIGVIGSKKAMKYRQQNDQKKKDKQWSTKRYTENSFVLHKYTGYYCFKWLQCSRYFVCDI
jgi:hypothetical protein